MDGAPIILRGLGPGHSIYTGESAMLDMGSEGTSMRLLLLNCVAVLTFAGPATPPSDSVPPAPITDLKVQDLQSDSTSASLVLSWTAPGDDGKNGTSWRYEMRIACGDLDQSGWPYAFSLTDLPELERPKPGGSPESLILELDDLDPDTNYTIRLKAVDEAGHFGELSNAATFKTTGHSRDFTETVQLNGMEVWVWGHQIKGDRLQARLSGCTFELGGFSRPLKPVTFQTVAHSDSWERHLRAIPRIQALMNEGFCLSEATNAYYREVDRLFRRAQILVDADSLLAAKSLLESSPLIEWVKDKNGTLDAQLLAHVPYQVYKTHHHERHSDNMAHHQAGTKIVYLGVFGSKTATRLVESVASHAQFAGRIPLMLFINRGGGTMYLSGEENVADARAQIAWLLETLSPKGMPSGPLHDPVISEILEANR